MEKRAAQWVCRATARAGVLGLLLMTLMSCGTRDEEGIYIVSADGANPRLIYKSGDCYHLTWSPSGNTIAFSEIVEGKDRLTLIDVSSRSVSRWSREFLDIDGIGWSPDGTQIIVNGVLAIGEGLGRLYLANADGTNLQALTPTNWMVRYPHWIIGSRTIVFARFEVNQPTRLYALDLETGSTREIYNLGNLKVGEIAWSPDGKRIAFTSSEGGNSEIYILNLATGNRQRLTFHEASDSQPAWSPDGKKIVFTSNRDGQNQVYTLHLESGEVKRISNIGGTKGQPSFSPDGTEVVFYVFYP